MAARLVKRCACLLREATLLAPVVAPVGRLRLASVAHRTLTFSATCPSSHFPGPLSGLVEKEQLSAPCPEHQEVERLIEKATRPEELLELLSDSRCLQENHAALMLIQLSRLLSDKPEDRALLVQDPRFQQLLHLVDSQISAVWHGTLVKLLRSLYALALPAACRELRSVEQEVRWRLRRLKYRQLAFLAESSATHMRESPELLAELLLHLERRWTEIDDGRTAVALMAKTGHLSEPLMNRLEDKCLELVERFGPDELRKVLVTLAAQNRRSVPLLRAVSYHLVQKPFPLTKGMLLDLAYAYGKLGFHQTQVLQRLAADLLPHVPSLTSGEVARGAKSFALLKWLSPPLFEALAQHVVDRAHTVTVPHLCNVLLAFAHLNFRPEREDKFFGLVHEKLGPKLRSLHPALQVDVVWALCVLQQVQGEVLRAVLCPELHARFLGSESPKDQSTFQKLLHISATAQLEHPEYTGPLLPASDWAPWLLACDGKPTPLQKELRDTLRGLLGSPSRGSFAVATQRRGAAGHGRPVPAPERLCSPASHSSLRDPAAAPWGQEAGVPALGVPQLQQPEQRPAGALRPGPASRAGRRLPGGGRPLLRVAGAQV
ncbi:FAST kinase domain-containing protein 4 isoform X4 [Prionailurus bengalensis]|uniref:FAST kinase domain-containing protein 4 isoform X4 n=1 Tax=Prionailurus bengalensis TaxID=37029 RepID=UPI001CA8C08F|nr:FAST kinase domain-containing protein 4 isoform X4 [Prionailurus bengalensis]XP_043444343.1 FAST kinase domain-containing protein 4 isoform X4 [Prionailurus bengalensis]